MGIENLKRWHWILVALIVGPLIAYVRLSVEPTQPRSIHFNEFANLIGQTHSVGDGDKSRERPWIKNVVIYPLTQGVYSKDVHTVTLMKDTYRPARGKVDADPAKGTPAQEAQEAGWIYLPHAMRIDVPGKPEEYGNSFRDWIAAQAKENSAISYKYAWWEEKPAAYGLWTLGCLVAIGGVWPTVINLLIGAGFAKPPKEANYDLERFGKYKEAQAATKAAQARGMSAEEQEQLARVTGNLERDLAPTGNRMPLGVGADQHPEQPVKKLDGKELEIANIEKEEEDKEYKGEFYPVARPVHHKEGEHPAKH